MRFNLLLALGAAGAIGVSGSANAEIFAGFEDQTTINSTFFTGNLGDSTAVDQWTGTAGDGWVDGWKVV